MVECDAHEWAYGRYQIDQAEQRLDHLKELLKKPYRYTGDQSEEEIQEHHYKRDAQYIIIDCQLIVEGSTKAIFPLFGTESPKQHGIPFEASEDLLNRTVDSPNCEFERKMEIPRAIFLTQFWESFYELAKYGAASQALHARDLLTATDAKRAVADAEFCLTLAKDLAQYQLERYKEDRKANPEDMMNRNRWDPDFDPFFEEDSE